MPPDFLRHWAGDQQVVRRLLLLIAQQTLLMCIEAPSLASVSSPHALPTGQPQEELDAQRRP
jgi:hypothetical protein